MIGQLLTGRYLILERLGAGGFSETYLARDKYLPHHPLCVVKYLKLSASNPISRETAERFFETEARILERLGQNHSQIPTLFAYCHEHEQVYLIQEYIEGENLGNWLTQEHQLSPPAAIALLRDILPVLDYLHGQGIVHRDIKPSNLIHRHQDGRLVLIDFGAACPIAELTSDSDARGGPPDLAVGTPGYMPDEQHAGEFQFNSDLYALGCLVIHLMTGVHPCQFQVDVISGELDWQHHLPPSLAIDPQLVTIFNRMVQIQSRDRYQQASEVLADLEILTNPRKSRSRRKAPEWRQWIKHVVIPGVAALVVGTMGGQYMRDHWQQAELFLNQVTQRIPKSDMHVSLVQDLPLRPGVQRLLIAPNNRVLVTAGADHGLRLWSLPGGRLLHSLSGHQAPITSLSISRDSRFLVSASQDGMIRLWHVDTGELRQAWQGHRNPITAMAISPDGQSLVSGCRDGTLRRWDLATGIRMQTLKLSAGEVTAMTYGMTTDRLITANSDRQIQVWDLATGQLRRTFAGHTAAIVGLQLADNQTLLSFGKDRGLIWDLQREELVRVFPSDSANPIAASFSEQHVITVHDNGSIRVWMPQSGRMVATDVLTPGKQLDAALSPNHHYLVSWSADQRLRVWQLN